MISPTPTSSANDWPSFGSGGQISTGTRAQASPFVPSLSSPPPHQLPSRPWGPTGLGGEALYNNTGRRATNLTDPIGSRPGSRLDERGMPTSPSPSPLGNQDTKAQAQSAFLSTNGNQHRPRASAAAAVAAAASSAAARSRAASPSNTSAAYFDLFPANNGAGFMSFGSSSLLPNPASRFDASNAQAQGANTQTDSQGFNMRSPVKAAAGTPTFVVDNVENGGVTRIGLEDQNTVDAWATGLETAGRRSPSTEGMTASFSALMSNPNDNFPFGPSNSSISPKPLRSNTDSSLMSNSATWNAGPQSGMQGPYYANSSSAAASTSSLQPNSGLLSPSAAVGGPQHINSAAASQGSSSLSTSQISLPQHNTFSPPAGPPGIYGAPAFGPMTLNPPRDASMQNTSSMASNIEAQLRMSPLFGEVVERLNRHENSVRELNRTIQTINRNISLLLERTKHMPPQQLGHQNNRAMSTPQPLHPYGMSGTAAGQSEEVRALAAQLNAVSATVSQLMAKTGGQTMTSSGMANGVFAPPNPLSGLGLGPNGSQSGSNAATPQMGSSSTGSGFLPPQPMGPFPVMPSFVNNNLPPNPRFNPAVGNIDTSMRQPSAERNSRLSPRPGVHSPNPNSRRWRDMSAGAPDGQVASGAMQPPDPSVIVTKWEHLNLHPDLLRSILRYGLGPPNKIQQRALPFLLRGSDIIAQAPPTQERIASYIIPVLQLVLNINRGEVPLPPSMGVRGPMALIISTTVDQATQAQRMAMGLGAALGIRVHIAAAAGLDVAQDASALIQTQPQIVVGTPQKMMDLFNYLANKTKGAISLDDIRIAVLDEVDQLIARNLADHVSQLLRILPSPRVVQGAAQPSAPGAPSPGIPASSSTGSLTSPAGNSSTEQTLGGINVTTTDRQTAIFSNTVPQDVLNFAQSIHLRESVRVLVRREGGAAAVQPAFPSQNGPGSGSSGLTANSADRSGQPGGQPVNALGASPANNHTDPLSDPVLASLRGLRQYYLYVAVTMGTSANGSGSASQAAHANEMKLDVITDMLEDMEFGQAIVYTGSAATQEAVAYKLATKGIEALSLQRDMASTTRQQVLSKYRSGSLPEAPGQNYQAAGQAIVGGPGGIAAPTPSTMSSSNGSSASRKKALIVHDFVVSPKDVQQVPLIVFYDLPRSVDEYKDKIAVAAAGGGRAEGAQSPRPSVCVNVVTGSGGPRGDIEMLRTLECHLGCKMAELPMNPGQILQL